MSDIDSQAVGRSAGGFCLLPAFNDIEFLESVIFYIQPCKKKILSDSNDTQYIDWTSKLFIKRDEPNANINGA